MILHDDKKLFEQTIRAASENLKIKEEFIEMDYWISLVLLRLPNWNCLIWLRIHMFLLFYLSIFYYQAYILS